MSGATIRVRRQSTGAFLTLVGTDMGGGEGKIYRVREDDRVLAKIYHPERRSPDRLAKLQAMLANSPIDPSQDDAAIAWPIDFLMSARDAHAAVGFLMPLARDARPIHDFYTPKTRRQEIFGFSYRYLMRMARNLAAAVAALHDRGYVIGDVNESNILAAPNTLVTLVDTDSFQVRDRQTGKVFRCAVGKPEYTPPELQGRNFRHLDRTPEHDCFGLAIILFQLLMEGTHPFDGIYGGSGDPPAKEARIAQGQFPYARRPGAYRPKPIAPPFDLLDPRLQSLFRQCFETGHQHPSARPSALHWIAALDAAEAKLRTCDRNDRHQYHPHHSTCPWCDRTERFKGRDPFPSRAAVLRGDHLKPVTPRRRPRTVATPTRAKFPNAPAGPVVLPIPKLNQVATFNPRTYWLMPGYSRSASLVSLIGFCSCVLVSVAIVLARDWLDYSTPGVPLRIPGRTQPSDPQENPTADSLSGNPNPEGMQIPAIARATALANFEPTREDIAALVDAMTYRLSQEFPDRRPSDLQQQTIITLMQVLGDPDLIYHGGAIVGPTEDQLFLEATRSQWIDAIYRYQTDQVRNILPLGYFDSDGITRRQLSQAIYARLKPQLSPTPLPTAPASPEP